MEVTKRDIDQWHRQRGWLKIGYHYVIQRNGTLETGREEDAVGAHVKGHNHDSIGICLIGGVNAENVAENNFTDEQFTTLNQLLTGLSNKYPDAAIVGHTDLDPKKACPSFNVEKWWNNQRNQNS